MRSVIVDGVDGNAWSRIPKYLSADIVEDQPLLRLWFADSRQEELMSIDIDFAAASELMVWLNTNISHTMTHPDDSYTLAVRSDLSPDAVPLPTPVDLPRGWYVECFDCELRATTYARPYDTSPTLIMACDRHRGSGTDPLPQLADVQLSLLYYLNGRNGVSTRDIANAGPVSWTVRNVGNMLGRLRTHGLVNPDRKGQDRLWSLTPRGVWVAAQVRYRA